MAPVEGASSISEAIHRIAVTHLSHQCPLGIVPAPVEFAVGWVTGLTNVQVQQIPIGQGEHPLLTHHPAGRAVVALDGKLGEAGSIKAAGEEKQQKAHGGLSWVRDYFFKLRKIKI